jgi:hypothetical protein
MGFIDLQTETNHCDNIRNALKKYNLSIKLEDEWEVHGPNQDMDYAVYAGRAYEENGESAFIAIYPEQAYWIEDPDDWFKPGEAVE